ncbi:MULTISPECIES: hypothetical protein [Kaistia]|jgi:hypothetical protein|uniref:Uncharacterized protein n=1 Tax=Kaistia defluvii TaxID=410841 RepID=A0ABV2QTG1_9HYPH|nr:hypothetical protein [Kaistia sp.]
MGTILSYSVDRRRRARANLPKQGQCEIIIFSGVRIDRSRPERPPPPQPALAPQPKPGRGG